MIIPLSLVLMLPCAIYPKNSGLKGKRFTQSNNLTFHYQVQVREGSGQKIKHDSLISHFKDLVLNRPG